MAENDYHEHGMVTCDKCGYEFLLEKSLFGVIKSGDLAVEYFSCPACGEKYHVFTADSEMRDLIEQRKAVQVKIWAAFAKKFQKKSIQKYEQELNRIIKKQESILPRLKSLGEKIIQGEAEP